MANVIMPVVIDGRILIDTLFFRAKEYVYNKRSNMIYKDVVNILKDTLSRFKGVNLVKYQGDDLNNQQHNYKTIQCYIDDISHHQFNLTTNIVKAEYNIYILGFPEHDTPDDILDVQDNCYNVAINVLYYIDNLEAFKGIVRVYDYSIMSLSRFTGQANAGVRLSVVLDASSLMGPPVSAAFVHL